MPLTARAQKMLNQIDIQLEEVMLNLQEEEKELAKLQDELIDRQTAVLQRRIKVEELENLKAQLQASNPEDIDLAEVCLDTQQQTAKSKVTAELKEPSKTLIIDKKSLESGKSSRSPMEMIYSKYKGKQLAEIIEIVLSESHKPLTTSEIARLIYETKSKDEFNRARNSLSTELRNGSKGEEPRWTKIGRYAYTSQAVRQAS